VSDVFCSAASRHWLLVSPLSGSAVCWLTRCKRGTREIGIRTALGATNRQVFAGVLRDALKSVAIGLAAGLAGAFALTRVLTKMLFGAEPADLATFALVSVYHCRCRSLRRTSRRGGRLEWIRCGTSDLTGACAVIRERKPTSCFRTPCVFTARVICTLQQLDRHSAQTIKNVRLPHGADQETCILVSLCAATNLKGRQIASPPTWHGFAKAAKAGHKRRRPAPRGVPNEPTHRLKPMLPLRVLEALQAAADPLRELLDVFRLADLGN
jgi:hypothetical protein